MVIHVIEAGKGKRYLANDLLRFSFLECFILQGILDVEMEQMVFYTFIFPNGLLLRNIS